MATKLGATLVESADPALDPDPDIEPMRPDFRTALARLVPVFMPDLLFRLTADGEPLFKDFAAAIQPTEFAPGKTLRHRHADPDRLLRRTSRRTDRTAGESRHRHDPGPGAGDVVPLSHPAISEPPGGRLEGAWLQRNALMISRRSTGGPNSGAMIGRAAFRNWEEVADPRNRLGGRQGVDERIMLRELLRRVDMMVMLENRLDALVRLHTPLPPARIGGAPEPGVRQNLRLELFYGPNAGLTEVLIPAGYVTTVYDPVFKLSPDGTRYISVAADSPTEIAAPGLPFSLVFRAEPGNEDVLLRIASAYEAASKRRVPPPAFGHLS